MLEGWDEKKHEGKSINGRGWLGQGQAEAENRYGVKESRCLVDDFKIKLL